jgi:uncharacterized protein YndB with AHSA1/START domain
MRPNGWIKKGSRVSRQDSFSAPVESRGDGPLRSVSAHYNKGNAMNDKSKPNEIYIERIYRAPVQKVWNAWADPDQAAQWRGPRGFTITNHSKELKAGGHWHYTMHGPDGVDYPNRTKYFEVNLFSRMVYDHGGNEDRPALFRVTVDFIDLGVRTKMEMTMALATAEAAVETKKFIRKVGGNSTWDRLAEFLEMECSGKDVFVMNETFEAPLPLMFELWTDTKLLEQWMGAAGSRITYLKASIESGGSVFYSMKGAGQTKLYGKADYSEVIGPSRLVYTQCFCNENGLMTRHPLAPTWPEFLKTTIEFEAENSDTTRVTIQWEVHGNATAIERETFHKAKQGMAQGWRGSLDGLETFLAKR